MMSITLPLFLLLLAQSVFAWGPTGHKIVAQIGENNLTPTAKAKVKALLPNVSLADISTWADTIKGKPEWKHTSTWHYVDIPDGETYEETEHAPEGDVITSITEMVKVLKSTASTIDEKQAALKFIVHLVGDIHQPLHVGRPDDRGGNDVEILFRNKKMNLHSLWDSGLINTQNRDYLAYAQYLETKNNKSYSPIDITAFPFSDIIKEDMKIRPQVYTFSKAIPEHNVLTDAYVSKNLNTLNTQLLQGGKRLAALLNETFK